MGSEHRPSLWTRKRKLSHGNARGKHAMILCKLGYVPVSALLSLYLIARLIEYDGRAWKRKTFGPVGEIDLQKAYFGLSIDNTSFRINTTGNQWSGRFQNRFPRHQRRSFSRFESFVLYLNASGSRGRVTAWRSASMTMRLSPLFCNSIHFLTAPINERRVFFVFSFVLSFYRDSCRCVEHSTVECPRECAVETSEKRGIVVPIHEGSKVECMNQCFFD